MFNQAMIVENIESPLSAIPFHRDVEGIERLLAKDFPLHLAIHKVKDILSVPAPYTLPHVHEFDEINILIGEELVYEIQLGLKKYQLKGNHSIFIPAGTLHASNVQTGNGYFIALWLHETIIQ